MSNDTITEAAMWRIVYRLRERDKEDRRNLKSAVNIDDTVFDEAIDLLLQVNLIEEVEQDVYRFKEEHTAADDWGGVLLKISPRVVEGGWPRGEDKQRATEPPQPPESGTKTRAVLEAFEPGKPASAADISRNVPRNVAHDGDAGAVHGFIATLVSRGFVEKIGRTGNLNKYQLTERGEEVIGSE